MPLSILAFDSLPLALILLSRYEYDKHISNMRSCTERTVKWLRTNSESARASVDESRKRVIRRRQRPASPGRTADCPSDRLAEHAACRTRKISTRFTARDACRGSDNNLSKMMKRCACSHYCEPLAWRALVPTAVIRFSGWVVPGFHLRLRRFIGMQGAIPDSSPDAVAADLRRNVLHPTIVLL